MLEGLAPSLLIGAVVVLVSILGVRVSGRWGVPSLLLYLLLGIVLGTVDPDLHVNNAELATVLGYSALVLILIQGGLTTRGDELRPVMWPAISLASVGIGASIVVVALPLVFFMHMDVQAALLLGAVLAATDAAAVFSMMRGLRIFPKLRTLLEGEAGFNDAPVVVIVSVLSGGTFEVDHWYLILPTIVFELVGGAVIGVAVGFAARWVLARLALPAVGLYPIAALALLVGAYGLGGMLHVSGFMAVYVAAILVGNARSLPHRRSIIGFADGLAWIAEIGLFVMLGLFADVMRLPSAIGIALIATAVLVLFARPLAAFVALVPFRIPMNWVGFVSFAGLRGAVPIVFATIPLAQAVPQAALVFDATMIVVLILLIVQAPMLPAAARFFNVIKSDAAFELEVESAPLDEMKAVVLAVDASPDSKLVGTFVNELGLPRQAVAALLVRDGEAVAIADEVRIRAGDRLVVVTGEEARSATEARLRSVAEHGRLGAWRGAS